MTSEMVKGFHDRKRVRVLNTCKHFKSVQTSCAVGRDPSQQRDEDGKLSCLRTQKGPGGFLDMPVIRSTPCACPEYAALTEAEYGERERERVANVHKLFTENKSLCCSADLDDSRTGMHNGSRHGPRTCSACGAVAYWV